MSEIIIQKQNLPTNLEDLSRFVLIGRDRLAAVRAAIRAIDKVGVAADVYQQKLAEGQEIAEAVLDAEVRLGELRSKVPRSAGGNRKSEEIKIQHMLNFDHNQTPLASFDEQAQIKRGIAQQLETLAAHPTMIERAKAEARENGEIVTRQAVLNAIRDEADTHKPHVVNNSGNNEWYTPMEYIEAARAAMGIIDLDPASSDIAQKTVKAVTYYTEQDDGLTKPWFGNVWLNPPYAADLVQRFASKMAESVYSGDVKQAIVLVNNATETGWFSTLVEAASAIVFTKGRIRYNTPAGEKMGTPLQGQAILYFGKNIETFLSHFGIFGWKALV